MIGVIGRTRIACTLWLALVAASPGNAQDRPSPPWEKPVKTGRSLFLENCSVCHEVNKPASQKFGPSLFRLFQEKRLAPDAVAAKIKFGGVVMPPFRKVLTDAQVDDLIAFIRSRQ